MAPKPMSKGLLGQVLRSKQQERDGVGSIPTLKTICRDVLISVRNDIRDVGEMPTLLIRPILEACSMQQLKLIENETRLGSGRSLKWDTWDLWRRFYLHDHGEPDFTVKVPPILTPKPADYDRTIRLCEGVPPGDWRKLYEDTSKKLAHKRDDTAMRMRMRYEEASKLKLRRTAQLSEEDTPAQKRKAASSSGSAGPSNPKERIKTKLGLKTEGAHHRVGAKKNSGSVAHSSGGSLRKRQLDKARPVSKPSLHSPAAARKRPSSSLTISRGQKVRASSAPPEQSRAAGGSLQQGASTPEAKRPKTGPPPPARMDVGSMISGMKNSIVKRYN